MRQTILLGATALLLTLAWGCARTSPTVSPQADITPFPTTTAVQPPATSRPETATPQPTQAPTPTGPLLTAIENLGRTGTPVLVDIATYRLVVDGLVERPLSVSYDELLSYPTVTQVPRLECPGFFVNYAQWTGPLVRTILEQAGIKPGATQVEFSDGRQYPYRATLTLEEALRDDTYLAHHVYEQILPVEHGYPVRLVVGSNVGSDWVKWLFHIEVK